MSDDDFRHLRDALKSAPHFVGFLGPRREFDSHHTGISRAAEGKSSYDVALDLLIEAVEQGKAHPRDIGRHLHAVWHEEKWGRPWVESLGHHPLFTRGWWKEIEVERDAKIYRLLEAYVRNDLRKTSKLAYAGAEKSPLGVERENEAVHKALLDHDLSRPEDKLTVRDLLIRQIITLCFGETNKPARRSLTNKNRSPDGIPGLDSIRKILRKARANAVRSGAAKARARAR